jgi:tRNA nucleotidyltransferase (CCA-adding enzyme)
MKVYLVGGAVRDRLLGRQAKDRDYVVTGTTAEALLAAGYERVGHDFPVFLHPETGEEYALARREKKVGAGYGGFDFETEGVTIEDDLLRRDLTINSMAQDLETGEIVDPHGGLKDLQQKVLRHTSKAFAEDPLRVVRLARFAARYEQLGFTTAAETLQLCHDVVNSGEMNALHHVRYWMELEKVFGEKDPLPFFRVLFSCGALERVAFFKQLLGTNFDYHKLLAMVAVLSRKDLAPEDKAGALATLTTPNANNFFHWARWARPYEALNMVRFWKGPVTSKDVLRLMEKTRAFDENSTTFGDLVLLMEVLEKTGEPLLVSPFFLPMMQKMAATVTADRFVAAGLEGAAIGQAMREARLEVLAPVLT